MDEAKWIAGHNLPGCLPNDVAFETNSWFEAKAIIIDNLDLIEDDDEFLDAMDQLLFVKDNQPFLIVADGEEWWVDVSEFTFDGLDADLSL